VREGCAEDCEKAVLLTAKECRQRAQEWLRLAATAADFFVQDGLVRRAADCQSKAASGGQAPRSLAAFARLCQMTVYAGVRTEPYGH
jgi:hypothetical protein